MDWWTGDGANITCKLTGMRKSCSNVDTGDTINYKGKEIKYLQRQCCWNVDVYSWYS
jgi:hypothetical protein